jgi:hypothetical protein
VMLPSVWQEAPDGEPTPAPARAPASEAVDDEDDDQVMLPSAWQDSTASDGACGGYHGDRQLARRVIAACRHEQRLCALEAALCSGGEGEGDSGGGEGDGGEGDGGGGERPAAGPPTPAIAGTHAKPLNIKSGCASNSFEIPLNLKRDSWYGTPPIPLSLEC